MDGILEGIESITIETDEENPEILVEITQESVIAMEGYRVRMKPEKN